MRCISGWPHPCGGCLPCLINARRIWAGRVLLEAQCHEHSLFSTFTYEKEPSDGSVHKEHISSTFHRLRRRMCRTHKTVRFFAVGEYGEQMARPHYHAAVFGVSLEDAGQVTGAWKALSDSTFGSKPGFCYHGTLTPNSAAYITGYISKKLTKKGDPAKLAGLGGREPEFAVMSRRPAIGALILEPLVEALNTSAGALYVARNGDVPIAFSVGGRLLPLGRTIRDHLRLQLFGETGQPKAAKLMAERRFNAELPAMPLDASPVLRARLLAVFEAEAKVAHTKYFETLKQRGVQVAKRHRINQSKRSI